MKRLISALLATVMLLSAMPMIGFAEGDESAAGLHQQTKNRQGEQSSKFDEKISDFNPDEWIDADVFDQSGVSLFSLGDHNLSSQYTVLLLDVSGSMSGTPIAQMKKAAIKFCDKMLSSSNNYISIVKYGSSASIACGFTDNLASLTTAINGLSSSGGTDMNYGIGKAVSMFDSLDTVYTKNLVIMSDGIPEHGNSSYTGKYGNTNSFAPYCNVVYETASGLWDKYKIYTLGFFHDLSGSTLSFAKNFMTDIQNSGYYNVENADSFEMTFEGLAGDILDRFSGGTGSMSDPVLINTYAQLKVLSEIVEDGTDCAGVYFKLNGNIAANNTADWKNGSPNTDNAAVFTPIGSPLTPFKGNFDGNGFEISGLYIDGQNYNALFGYIENGSIKNVSVKSAYVTGESYTAGIAAYAKNSSLTNCTFGGKVSSKSGDYVAGIGACCVNTNIKGCTNNAHVQANNMYAGGITAVSRKSAIDNCTNNGAVTGRAFYVGGISGFISDVNLTNFKNLADIGSNKIAGGICGKINSSQLSNGFAICKINAKDTAAGIGGIVEKSGINNVFSDCPIEFSKSFVRRDCISFAEKKNTDLVGVYYISDTIPRLPTEEQAAQKGVVDLAVPRDEFCSSGFLALLHLWVNNNSSKKYNNWIINNTRPDFADSAPLPEAAKVYGKFDYDCNDYNDELALLCAKYSAYTYENYLFDDEYEIFYTGTEDSERFKTVLRKDGFPEESIKSYKQEDKNDIDNSATFTLASKTVSRFGKNRNLILVAIRGTDGKQWYGNMDVTGRTYDENLTDFQQSFKKGALYIRQRLSNYISENNFAEDSVILITGHSRGGALANMLAYDLTSNSYAGIDKNNIFAYCFAVPAVTTDTVNAGNYKNIFNFCFEDDFVPRFPLSSWGYTMYGTRYSAVAERLYNKKQGFHTYADLSLIMSKGRTASFNYSAVENVYNYIPRHWDTTKKYYEEEPYTTKKVNINNKLLSGPSTWIIAKEELHLYEYLHDYLSAFMAGDGSALKLLSKADSSVYLPILAFLLKGNVLQAYLNDNHQMYTYYNALKTGGFKVSPQKSDAADEISLFASAEKDRTEINALKTFFTTEDNTKLSGCNPDDVDSWDFAVWENGHIVSIDLYYKQLYGNLDLSNFKYLRSLNVSGNEITSLKLDGCTALTELFCADNFLTELNIAGLPLKTLDCSANYLNIDDESDIPRLALLDDTLVHYEGQKAPSKYACNKDDWNVLKNVFSNWYLLDGEGTEENPYKIYTLDDLITALAIMESSHTDYFELCNDIVINDISDFDAWGEKTDELTVLPYGYASNDSFNGNGHSLTGLYGSQLFDVVNNSAIYDLNINSAYINSRAQGVLFNNAYGTTNIRHCSVTGKTVFNNSGMMYGGIGGSTDETTIIENCINAANIKVISSNGDAYVGGILSNGSGIANCVNSGDISIENRSDNAGIGVVCGIGNADNVFGCINSGNISVNGFEDVGCAGISSKAKTLKYCTNSGDISVSGGIATAGGIVIDGTDVTDCINVGDIPAAGKYGPIAPSFCYDEDQGKTVPITDLSGTFSNCYFLGNDYNSEDTYGKALTDSELLNTGSFDGFDFEYVWTMGEKCPLLEEAQRAFEWVKEIDPYDNIASPDVYDKAFDELSKYAEWKMTDGEYRIVSIDISGQELDGTVDLSELAELKYLDCSDNKIDMLVLPQNYKLENLNCSNNELTCIEGLCDNLKSFACANNRLNVYEYKDIFDAICANGGVVNSQGQRIDASLINQADADVINALIEKLALTDVQADTWSAVEWINDNNSYFVSSLDLGGFDSLTGVLDLTALSHLNKISAPYTNINELKLPDRVKNIGDGAFYGCEELMDVYLPESLQSIGDRAFADCSSLSNIALPLSLESIGSYAFMNCETLKSVYLPKSVSKIGACAYSGCHGLINVYFIGGIPSDIGSDIFAGCAEEVKIYSYSENNAEADFAFTVIPPFSIKTAPSKIIYEPNDTIDLTGLTLEYVDADGSIKEITDGFSADYDFSEVGETTVTVGYMGYEVEFDVIVRVAVKGVSLDISSINMEYMEERQLIAAVTPANATDPEIIWTSGNTDVVTVDENGKICAVGSGTTIVTAETVDGGFTAECEVNVHVAVSGIKLEENSMQIYVGETHNINYEFTPKFSTNSNVLLEVSNDSPAEITLNDGFIEVQADWPGFADVTITTEDGGFSDTLHLCVKRPKMSIEAKDSVMLGHTLEVHGEIIGEKNREYEVGIDYGKTKDEVLRRENTDSYGVGFSSNDYRAKSDVSFEIIAKPNTDYYYRLYIYSSYDDKYFYSDIISVKIDDYLSQIVAVDDGSTITLNDNEAKLMSFTVDESGFYDIDVVSDNRGHAYCSVVDSEFNLVHSGYGNMDWLMYLKAGETYYVSAVSYASDTYTVSFDKAAGIDLKAGENDSYADMSPDEVCSLTVSESGLYRIRCGDADMVLRDLETDAGITCYDYTCLYLEKDKTYYLLCDDHYGVDRNIQIYVTKYTFGETVNANESFNITDNYKLVKFVPDKTGFYTADVTANAPQDINRTYGADVFYKYSEDSVSYDSGELCYNEDHVYTLSDGTQEYEHYSDNSSVLMEQGNVYYINAYFFCRDEDESTDVDLQCVVKEAHPQVLKTGENIIADNDVVSFTPKVSGEYRFTINRGWRNGIEYYYKGKNGYYVHNRADLYYSDDGIYLDLERSVTYYFQGRDIYSGQVLVIEEPYSDITLPDGIETEQLTEGMPTEVNIGTPGEYRYYTFTPSATEIYYIGTEGSCDTECTIFDDENDCLLSDNDSGNNYNFAMYIELEKGKTYTLEISLADPTDTGTFSLAAERRLNVDKLSVGDVNGDGDIDFADAILLLKHDVGLKKIPDYLKEIADVNNDGDVDFADAIQVLKYDVGMGSLIDEERWYNR